MLRAFLPDDWAALNAVLSDTEAMEHMHFRSWNDEQRRTWFDECLAAGQHSSPDGMSWAVERKDTGEVIGWFGIGPGDGEGRYAPREVRLWCRLRGQPVSPPPLHHHAGRVRDSELSAHRSRSIAYGVVQASHRNKGPTPW